jgi:hypothetical protein
MCGSEWSQKLKEMDMDLKEHQEASEMITKRTEVRPAPD